MRALEVHETVLALVAAALAEEEADGGGLGVTHENFTDVDGVFNADPRLCPNATRIPILSYNQTRALESNYLLAQPPLCAASFALAAPSRFATLARAALHMRVGVSTVARYIRQK